MDISVENLSKYYGKGDARTLVLDHVDLTIDEGEFVAIIGTSGSGKTTLLNILGGLDRDFDGSARVGDYELSELGERELAGLRNQEFGFVFQQFNLLDHLSAQENVFLPEYFDRTGQSGGEARAGRLLERVGLGDKLDERPPRLSGGQKQRVAIARALFNRPTLIFCDEPTGSLDRKTGLQIMKVFQDLNREDDMTLIVVTHEEHIAKMARRIIRLEDGSIVADEPNEPVQPDELGLLRLGDEDPDDLVDRPSLREEVS
ncbi:MAG: ABC transporter ATP-binding protein [Myxococcota bacterium]